MKYLQDLIVMLKAILRGIQAYPEKWKDQPYTPEYVQAAITTIEDGDKAVGDAETNLSKAQAAARQIYSEKQAEADKIVKIALGFHSDNPDQLIDYGIKSRKPYVPKMRPEQILKVLLTDDTDGVGFIVSTQKDSVANNYEWQKGQGANPADTNTIPEMKFFKFTSKTTFVDDDVAKGVRYFYRVRAVNTAGDGPWSEPVSKVQ